MFFRVINPAVPQELVFIRVHGLSEHPPLIPYTFEFFLQPSDNRRRPLDLRAISLLFGNQQHGICLDFQVHRWRVGEISLYGSWTRNTGSDRLWFTGTKDFLYWAQIAYPEGRWGPERPSCHLKIIGLCWVGYLRLRYSQLILFHRCIVCIEFQSTFHPMVNISTKSYFDTTSHVLVFFTIGHWQKF